MRLIFLLLILLPHFVFAKISEQVVIKQYPVIFKNDAPTEKEIQDSVPICVDGKKYMGCTKWNVYYTYEPKTVKDTCRIIEPTVTLKAEIMMPGINLRINRREFAEIYDIYNRFYNALLNHEYGHIEFGKKAAVDINSFLSTLYIKGTCDEAKSFIKVKVDSIINKYSLEELEYDKRTNHGENDGSSYPF